MRTLRQTAIRRALLHVLSLVPETYLVPDRLLKSQAASDMLPPAPTTAELDAEIREADVLGLIVSVVGEDSLQRKLSDAGRAWLAEHA